MNLASHKFMKPSRLGKVFQLAGRFWDLRATIGFWNTLKLYLGHRCAGSYTLRLPFLKGPLHLRGRTSDANVFRKVFIAEEYHVPNIDPQLIVDAGANIGLSAIYFAALFPKATVLCLEPEGANIEQFKRNTAAYPNIQLIQGALWSRTARLFVTNPNADTVSFVVKECPAREEGNSPIEGYDVEELLSKTGHDRIDILKIDIEGSESEVFGAQPHRWLARVDVLLIELHENKSPGCSRIFFDATAKHRFQYYHRGENAVLVKEELIAA